MALVPRVVDNEFMSIRTESYLPRCNSEPTKWLQLFHCVIALLCWTAYTSTSSVAQEELTVTRVEQIHRLGPDKIQAGVKIDLECIVLIYEPDWSILFVHDGEHGLYAGDVRDMPYRRGDRIRIRGDLSLNRVPIGCTYERSDNGIEFPKPKIVEYDWLQAPNEDSQLVMIQSQLVGISKEQLQTTLEMRSKTGGRFRALIHQSKTNDADLRRMLGKELKLQGVVGARFDSKSQWTGFQIWLGETTSIEEVHHPSNPTELPVVPIAKLNDNTILETQSSYFHTKGKITHQLATSLAVLQDNTHSLFVEFQEQNTVQLDQSYKISGSLDTSVVPSVLRMAEATPIDEHFIHHREVASRNVRELIEGDFSGRYVRTSGTYAGTIESRGQTGFLLQARGDLLPVFLNQSGDKKLGSIVAGTQLDVSGIWVQQKSLVGFNIGSCALHTRVDSIKVGTQIPWFLLSVIGTAGLLTGSATVWGMTLKRQVRIKTQQFLDSVATQRRIEEQYANVFIHARVMVITTDANGIVTAVNPATVRVTGREEAQLIGIPVYELVHADSTERLQELLIKATQSDDPNSCEVQFLGRNHSILPQEVSVWTTFADGNCSIHLLWHDITERLRIQQQRSEMDQRLQSMQKMESLGVLAGGIAHDFNNLLTVIVGHACLLEIDPALSEKIRTNASSINQAARRAADLTQQMLAYAGRGRFDIRVLDMTEQVNEIVPLFSSSLASNVQLQLNTLDGLPGVKADATQIKQILLNLIQNASEAMVGRTGKISIQTFSAKAPPKASNECFVFSFAEDAQHPATHGYVCTEVSDEGIGIEESKLERIFDPFFTTKFSGRGLGLSTVLGIVKAHKGSICVRSTRNIGTAISIFLPACSERVSHVPAPHYSLLKREVSARVIVVDDEDAILRVIADAFASSGLTIDCFNNGKEALEFFRKSPNQFDCLITDLTMPEIDGLELVSQIRSIDTKIPIILCSGYTLDSEGQSIKTPGVNSTLQKPFQPAELIELVHSLLNSSREASHL